MLIIWQAVVGLLVSGPTLAAKVRAACVALGIPYTSAATALAECNRELGIDAHGPLNVQADEIVVQLGLCFDEPPAPAPPHLPDPSMPRMVVFDLDFTLWRPELYQLQAGPPFRSSTDGSVLTQRGERIDLFPAAQRALRELADHGVGVAIASRASEVAWACEIMRLMRIDEQRTMSDVIGDSPVVIQGGSKVRHLKHIGQLSGVPLHDMLFFDNERGNIQDVEKIGPTCVHCPRGLTDEVFRGGLELYASAQVARSTAKSPGRTVVAAGKQKRYKGGGRRGGRRGKSMGRR